MMNYLSFRREDWSCMTQLFLDNTSILLGVLVVLFNLTYVGVPVDVIDEVQDIIAAIIIIIQDIYMKACGFKPVARTEGK